MSGWRPAVASARARGDDGSIIAALMIMVVICILGSLITTQIVGEAQNAVARQGNASAVSLADAGLADALFRIDQGTAGTGSGTAFCVAPNDPKCIASSVPAAPGVSYVATATGSTQWVVVSSATVGARTAAVQEEVTRASQYPFALFGNTSLLFNGNAGQSFTTYDDTEPAGGGDHPNPNPNGAVALGSNGTITCTGALGPDVTVEYFGTGGVGSQGSACGTYQSLPNRYYLAPRASPSGALACPNAGLLGSGIAGAPTTLVAGTYLCTTPVTISGLLDVSGQVQFYVMLDPTVYGSSTAAVTITSGSYVNDHADYCANGGTSACTPTPDLPDAENLQIFSNSTGTFGNDAGSGYWLGAILYAPTASLTGDGCKSVYYGSLVINTLTCNGGPHLTVNYDSSLTSMYGPWAASGYTQVNPSAYTNAMSTAGL